MAVLKRAPIDSAVRWGSSYPGPQLSAAVSGGLPPWKLHDYPSSLQVLLAECTWSTNPVEIWFAPTSPPFPAHLCLTQAQRSGFP